MIELRESGHGTLLFDIDPSIHNDIDAREQWRSGISREAQRLQTTLGLRDLPLRLVDGADGLRLNSSGIAGTVRIGRREFDIAPKHVSDPSSAWRPSLLVMIERAARRRIDFTVTDHLSFSHMSFVDYFAFAFSACLDRASRREQVRLYRSQRETSPVLRGRLLVSEQLRSALTRPHLLVCEVDRLDSDNPVNQLLRWAGSQLLKDVRDGGVRRALSHQLDKLPPVSRSRPPLPFRNRLPQQFAHYSTAVELALALVRAQGPDPRGGASPGAGFAVGTERLFEQFVEQSLLVASAGRQWTVDPQLRERFAVAVAPNEGRDYFSQPDNVVRLGGKTTLVVDAKYKRFEDASEDFRGGRPTNADLYQMAAAGVAHGCNRALLLYPRLGSSDDAPIRWWSVQGWKDQPIKVGVATLDLDRLGTSAGLLEFDTMLGERIDEALL